MIKKRRSNQLYALAVGHGKALKQKAKQKMERKLQLLFSVPALQRLATGANE
jgi:hypothetical protein